jgi:hypothetical protein
LNCCSLHMSKSVCGKTEKETSIVKRVSIRTGLRARQMFKHPVSSRVPRGISEHLRRAPDPYCKYWLTLGYMESWIHICLAYWNKRRRRRRERIKERKKHVNFIEEYYICFENYFIALSFPRQ